MKKENKKIILLGVILFLILLIPLNIKAKTKNLITFPEKSIDTITSIYSNDEFAYYTYSDKIYRLNVVTKDIETIYTFSKDEKLINYDYYLKDNILYLLLHSNGSLFIGIDLQSKKEVYRHSFSFSTAHGISFLFDSEQNLYIENNNAIEIYDKTGKLIDSVAQDQSNMIILSSLNNDEHLLIVNIVTYSPYKFWSAYFVLDDSHHFTKDVGTIIGNGTFENLTYFNKSNYAIDQHGYIWILDASDLDKPKIGYSYKRMDVEYNTSDVIINETNTSAYLANQRDSYIYEMNPENNFSLVGKYSLDDTDINIQKIYKRGNKLYVLYTKVNGYYDDIYLVVFDDNEETKSKNIVINTHKSLTYTKDEVLKKYNDSKYTYDYSKSIFSSEPKYKSPYYEGVLKDEVKNDVLRQLNYYRWQAGLNSISLNTAKMQRSQKGALLDTVINTLTHYPYKPDDMNEDFYNEAYYGVNTKYEAGDTYSGNVSYGDSVNDMIKGFVDDEYNLFPDVGHRLSMLDPYAISTSFGYTPIQGKKTGYGAVSIYYDTSSNHGNNEPFYAWPSPGYMPTEAISAGDTMFWSIQLMDDYSFSADASLTLTYKGKDYKPTVSVSGKELIYRLPSDLYKLIARSNNQFVVDEPIKFKFTGITKGIDNVTIEYSTTFIQAQNIPIESADVWVSSNPDVLSGFGLNEYTTFEKGDKKYFFITTKPSNATVSSYQLTSSDESILKIDNESRTIQALKTGTVSITIKEKQTGYTKVIKNIKVICTATGIKLNTSSLFLPVNRKEKLIVSLVPEDSTDYPYFTWSSNNKNVADVDSQGNVTAKSKGTAVITVSWGGFSAKCNVAVGDFLKGDLNRNNSIELEDVMAALLIVTGKKQANSTDIEIGDFDNNKIISTTDAFQILNIFVNGKK